MKRYFLTYMLTLSMTGLAQVTPEDELEYYNLSQQLALELVRHPQKMDSILTEIDTLDAVLLGKRKIASNNEILRIGLKYVSYMCEGYCTIKIEVRPTAKTVVRIPKTLSGAKSDQEIIRTTKALTPTDWKRITGSFSIGEIQKLPERVGCPGCDDAAIATLTVSTPYRSHTVTFEGPDPPESIQALTRMLTADVFKE